MNPKISVILPVYNQEKFIKEAIESILNQSYSNFELIIINDGSTDNSEKIITSFKDKRIKIIKNNINHGLTKALNLGMKNAKGEFIARMDGDDISYANRFKLQLKAFEKDGNVYLIGGQACVISINSKKLKNTRMPTRYQDLKKVVIKYNPFIHPTVMFKKILINKIGYFNENYRYAQDYDFVLRAINNFKCINLKEPILALRLNSNSISASKHQKQQLTAVAIRLNAIINYKYPMYSLLFLVKPFVSALIPYNLKKRIYPFYV